jgi:large subunit ribosomal protein L21
MYAIVSIAGQQFKVEKGKKVYVHRLPGAIGDEISFDKVMLIHKEEKVDIGSPYLPNAVVSAQIVAHLRGDKVLVFKKKRRKGYQKLNGHRQDFTEILIDDISENGEIKKTEKKKVAASKPVVVAEESAEITTETPVAVKAPKKAVTKKEDKEAPKKAAPVKKPAKSAEKPAAKKPAAKAKTEKKSEK